MLIRQPLPEINLNAITLKPIDIDTCLPMTRYVYHKNECCLYL